MLKRSSPIFLLKKSENKIVLFGEVGVFWLKMESANENYDFGLMSVFNTFSLTISFKDYNKMDI